MDLSEILYPLAQRVRRDVTAVRRPDRSIFLSKTDGLTKGRLEEHVNGGVARGVYLVKPGESTCMMALLDLDDHKGTATWQDMLDVAWELKAPLEARGLRCAPWRSSGGNGIHLIFVWNAPQDAYSVREALRAAIAAAGFEDGTAGVAEGEIEIFPKQDSVPAGGYGSQVWLPLSGKSVPLVDSLVDEGWMAGRREDAADYVWPVSEPVPVLVKPERNNITFSGESVAAETLRELLAHIKCDAVNYQLWLDVGMSLHHATSGDEEGLELWASWSLPVSAGGATRDVTEYKYRSFKLDKESSLTIGTLQRLARAGGWVENIEHMFMPAVMPEGEKEALPLPPLEREKSTGKILATLENVEAWLKRPDVVGETIKFDTFRDEIMFTPVAESAGWRPFQDTDYTRLRIGLAQRGFKPIPKDIMRDVVHRVAFVDQFDTAIEWLNGLRWDGVPRVDRFLTEYFGASNDNYVTSVSRYMWSAMAGRVLSPGIKADMVPVLIGLQGVGKSFGISELVPSSDHYESIDLMDRDSDMSRRMRGKLVMEIGELKGLHNREMESIKEFITRTHESFRPLYGEFFKKYPRRGLFIGTTNQEEFLADSTGNRRWLPVRGGAVRVDDIKKDRLQLWAEGRELFRHHGVMWKEAQELAEAVHEEHRMSDVWMEQIVNWLHTSDFNNAAPPIDWEYVTLYDVLSGALRFESKNIKRGDEMRAAAILRELGFTRKKIRKDNKLIWVWIK